MWQRLSWGWSVSSRATLTLKARRAYQHNFGIEPAGDITAIESEDIPDHDVLMAGFPCQPFSIIGAMRGFDDVRGTLFFNLAEAIEAKKPVAVLLENVRQLSTHNRGRTLTRIIEVLEELGYRTDWKVLNALDFGLAQKRERTFIVGFRDNSVPFDWPEPIGEPPTLDTVLENDIPDRYFASEHIRLKRQAKHRSEHELAIWHENKGGNVSSHPFSCALRAGASYNYLLVNGERRLTPREMLRLQGFPESFELPGSYQQIRKQTGNAVPAPVVKAVLEKMVNGLSSAEAAMVDTVAKRFAARIMATGKSTGDLKPETQCAAGARLGRYRYRLHRSRTHCPGVRTWHS